MGSGNSSETIITSNHASDVRSIYSEIEELRRFAEQRPIEQFREAIEDAFARLKKCTLELAQVGNLDGLNEVGKLYSKLGELSWEYGHHETDEVFFAARVKHFAADDEVVRAALSSEVSDDLCLELLKSALKACSVRILNSALNSQGTRDLTLEMLVEGFTVIKTEGGPDHSTILSGAFSWISAYLDTPGRLPRAIDIVARNMPVFEPHLRMFIEKSHSRSQNPDLVLKTTLDSNMALPSDFWVGLYKATENPVVLEAAEAWMAYPVNHEHFAQLEEIGLVKPQEWHDTWQNRALTRYREYFFGHAIRTPGVELSVQFEHKKFDKEMAAAVLSTLEKADATTADAMEKVKKLFDALSEQMELFKEAGETWLDHQVAASSIPYELIEDSMKMRRDRFMYELGM